MAGTTWLNHTEKPAFVSAPVGAPTSRRATRPPGRSTLAISPSDRVEVGEVAQREAADDAVGDAVGDRERDRVALRHRCSRRRRRCEHPEGQVEADDASPRAAPPRRGRRCPRRRRARRCRAAGRASGRAGAPPRVEPERSSARFDELVARRDRVEHLADAPRLLGARREARSSGAGAHRSEVVAEDDLGDAGGLRRASLLDGHVDDRLARRRRSR